MKYKINFLVIVFSLIFSLYSKAQSYPKWMNDINATDCIKVSQGKDTSIIVADEAYVYPLQTFSERVFYFDLKNNSLLQNIPEASGIGEMQWKMKSCAVSAVASLISAFFLYSQLNLGFFPSVGSSILLFSILYPYMESYFKDRFLFSDHTTGVATLILGSDSVGGSPEVFGLAKETIVISVSNLQESAKQLSTQEEATIGTIKTCMDIDYKNISVYDKTGLNIQIAQNLNPINIISASLGSRRNKKISNLAQQFDWDLRANQSLILIIAAGNDGKNKTIGELEEEFPHLLYKKDYVFLVAAMSEDALSLKKSSNYNKDFVRIAAPGENIPVFDNSGAIVLQGGTSFSVPFVSATAALIASCNRSLTSQEIENVIFDTADVVPDLKDKVKDGRKLNVCRAVEKVCSLPSLPRDKKIRSSSETP